MPTTADTNSEAAGDGRTRPQREEIQIALFGPTGGGKTTFLLGLLCAAPKGRYEGWRATPTLESEEYDNDLREIVGQRFFPQGTTDTERATWIISGKQAGWGPLRWLPERFRTRVSFRLTVTDRPGDATVDPSEELLATLAEAHGLILLLNPTLLIPGEESETKSQVNATYHYLHKLLPRLDARFLDKGGDGLLPHHVAVCVTMFDDPQVYDRARRLGIVHRGPRGQQPFVASGPDACQLFEQLCRSSPESLDSGIPELLRQRFEPSRISYHVISSVGFYIDESGVFREETSPNVIQLKGRPAFLRIAPINVWETLAGLYDSIAARRR